MATGEQDARDAWSDGAWDAAHLTHTCEGHTGPWSGARGPAAPTTYCIDTEACVAPGATSAYVIDELARLQDAYRDFEDDNGGHVR